MTVHILGGGISGLSAAFYLCKKIPPNTISIWEASKRTGGWIQTHKTDTGILFEQAARTLRPRSETGTNTLNLIEELQLIGEIRPIYSSSPAAKNRLIYVNGKLHTLPSSLLGLFRTQSPFSKPLIVNFINEHKQPIKKVVDESIYDFMNRRFGSEVADYLMSPLICGICAGNSKEISVNFLATQLFQYEQNYGSITRGLLHNIFSSKKNVHKSALLDRVKSEKWSVYSFKNGLETLPSTLENVISSHGVEINLNTKCDKVEFFGKEVIIHNQHTSVKSKHLFSTLLSEIFALLISDQHPKLSVLLKQIQSVDVAVVNLHFKGNLIKNPAFGLLVPPQENLPILGIIFDSCCFSQKNDTVLTVMMGGYWFKRNFENFKTDEEFFDVALAHVKKILKIDEEPLEYKVNILKNCIPQYTVGHRETVNKIKDYVESSNLPLSLCGMSYDGVGVNDVILSAKKSVESFLQKNS
ncbi:protoporphyrinogen oxidase [Coccinella septempunctata]|uniref:protoporphyrinogen oxidase n=1 Tax=Coccinella septempunctata TaxID=41139 RepID=UPI001D0991BE|nr:protoporphyrinogen oxidase [Coccinella septempunctata]